ncbi:sulfatase-like hydrolase/transferase [bacterium]|nr:sulfatase-like hydrolase/transferase [bacterium]
MIGKTKITAFFKSFLPKFDVFQISVLLFFTVLNIIFLVIASEKNGFSFTEADVLFHFSIKLLFDAAFLLFSVLILKAVFRTSVFSALFITANATLAISNILLYYFGNTLVERTHFALITPYSVTSFVPWYGFAAIFAALFAILAASFFFIRKIPFRNIFKQAAFWLTICILLNLLNISNIVDHDREKRYGRVIGGFRNAQIYYISQNQWINFLSKVIFPSLSDKIKMFYPETEKFVNDYHLFSEKFTVSNDPIQYKKDAEKFDPDLFRGEPESLNLKEYSRVIYILTESVSLDALPCYNDRIKGSYANRLFCRKEIMEKTFSNLTTSGSPTLQGLTVIFNSHPNYNIQEQTGHINSFPKLLEKHGFKSVFIRSASKFFANENLIFQNMGFSRTIAREDFYEHKDLRKYIYNWGLEDRILYQQSLEFIKENRDKKLFITILGTDTHPPYGQKLYKHLKYPEAPKIENIKDKKTSLWLTSVDRMDFDIAGFLENLEKEGLFDESTLVVISSDHSCPLNNVSSKIPGHPKNNLARIPVIFLSKQTLPEADYSTKASQIDIAPTIFHLLGIKKPLGWWGESLFSRERKGRKIGFDKNFLYFSDDSGSRTINTEKTENASEEALINIFDTVFMEK